MDVMNYSDARAHFKGVMDRAINDQQEVVVTRKKGEAVVVVSLEAWNAINETLHLCPTRTMPLACVQRLASLIQLMAKSEI